MYCTVLYCYLLPYECGLRCCAASPRLHVLFGQILVHDEIHGQTQQFRDAMIVYLLQSHFLPMNPAANVRGHSYQSHLRLCASIFVHRCHPNGGHYGNRPELLV
ncbi:unnamed protein product [Ascophyllum nodosum]